MDNDSAPSPEPTRRETREKWFLTDDLQKDLGRRSARGGAMTLGTTGINFIVTTVSTVLITRNLTDEDFGLFAMVTVFTGFAAMFVDLGLSRAVIQKPDINHAQVSTLFWINLALAALLSVTVAGLTPVIVWFYDEPKLMPINLAMSGLFLVSALTIQHRALLTRRMEFKKLNLIQLVAAPVSAAVAVTVALLGGGVWALVSIPVANQVVIVLGTGIACRWVPGIPRRGSGVRSLLAYGGNLTGSQFVGYISRTADNLFIGYAWGDGPLGLYARSYSLMMMPVTRLNAPLTNVVVPALSRLTDQPERYRKFYLACVQMVCFTLTSIVGWMVLNIDDLVPALLGPNWLAITPIFYALAPACVFTATNVSSGWLYLSYGHVDRQLRWSMIYAAVLVLAMCVGLQYGVFGTAIAVSAAVTLMKPFVFYGASKGRGIDMSDFVRFTYGPIFLSLIAGVAATIVAETVSPLSANHWGTVSIKTLIYVSVWLAWLLLLPSGKRFLELSRTLATQLRS